MTKNNAAANRDLAADASLDAPPSGGLGDRRRDSEEVRCLRERQDRQRSACRPPVRDRPHPDVKAGCTCADGLVSFGVGRGEDGAFGRWFRGALLVMVLVMEVVVAVSMTMAGWYGDAGGVSLLPSMVRCS